ncbi:PDDEXK nuclease domain-containing protein [Prevotella communis]|uniref:PDDEXK nuclease domain-containing protein n=1 Tax=Prevotella communis TaxID=2913614 RepID=UPI001EDC23B6|nr:PDDEXK nuclease domain-containing protein [Prevotella communis]UKK55913.1 PDDEXK nuclease domain-containing protein [Prevotella communis]
MMTNEIMKYEQQFEEIRGIISMHREKALRDVNEESLLMSWTVGRIVSERLKSNEWGSKVVVQLSEYLRAKDPTLKGYSRRNIYNMVMFYEEYSSEAFVGRIQSLSLPDFVQTQTAQKNMDTIVQMPSAQLPQILCLTTFSNHLEILNRCKMVEQRIFYILYAYKERLKNKELQRCILNDTYGSLMGNKKNFSAGLKQMYPQSPSLIKDRAFVDFLSLPEKHNERQLHKGLLDHMKQFILELGKDFLYVDSEYPLQVGGSTFKVDLLFYHRGLQCLVAIELKAKKFKPEYMGQLEFYLEALDRDVKRSNENPSIGILLCQSADQSVVEYAMSRSLSPTMVAEYHRQLIPKEVVQKSLEEFCTFLKDFKGK